MIEANLWVKKKAGFLGRTGRGGEDWEWNRWQVDEKLRHVGFSGHW